MADPVMGMSTRGLLDRPVGVETEYGVALVEPGRTKPRVGDTVAARLFPPDRTVVGLGGRNGGLSYLRNGGRVYLDVGGHPEYATAECRTLVDLLAQLRAGELLLQGFADAALPGLAHSRDAVMWLVANNRDCNGVGYGCHENYSIPRSVKLGNLVDGLSPFLIARTLLCGAGAVAGEDDPSGQPAGTYLLAQRTGQISRNLGDGATRDKALVSSRDEPHADAERFRRLHVTGGDTVLFDVANLIKVGGTALVIRALERGATPPAELRGSVKTAMVAAATSPFDGSGRIPTVGGRAWTVAGLLRAYHNLAASVAETPDDAEVLDWWDRALTAAESGDMGNLSRWVDWAGKAELIDRCRSRDRLTADNPRLRLIDLRWHVLGTGLARRLEAAGRAERLVDDDAAARAALQPPWNTRAAGRAAYIQAVNAGGMKFAGDWSRLKALGYSDAERSIDDPGDPGWAVVADALENVRDLVGKGEEPKPEQHPDNPWALPTADVAGDIRRFLDTARSATG